MGCVYQMYVDTYRAVASCAARGVRLDELQVFAGKSLEGAQVGVAQLAVNDAINRIPTRSRVHICRLRLVPTCAMCMSGVGADSAGGIDPHVRMSARGLRADAIGASRRLDQSREEEFVRLGPADQDTRWMPLMGERSKEAPPQRMTGGSRQVGGA